MGGFGFDATISTTESSTDATGIALQALATATSNAATAADALKRRTIVAATAYLSRTVVGGNHWQAWGDYDTNGTAYAAMGLAAAGRSVSPIRKWLASKIASDGGLQTPWSDGLGDRFATAQSYLALRGLDYMDLVTGVRP